MENNPKIIIDFCYKYNIPEDILVNYIASLKINDIPSMDTYKLILEDCCPFEQVPMMRKELKELIKHER